MKILAVESSSKTASAALLEDGELIGESFVKTDTHSAVLLPMIEDLLKAAKTDFSGIGLYAASVGPGSFTGVRIGVSTVKGLAFAGNTPAAGVSTLEGMAYQFAGVDSIAVPVIDARRGTVFTAVFRASSDGKVERLTPDAQLPAEELMKLLGAYPGERIAFTGDAADAMLARADCPGNARPAPALLRNPSAAGIGRRAWEKWIEAEENRDLFDSAALVPVYLKKSQAEREREERLAGKRE